MPTPSMSAQDLVTAQGLLNSSGPEATYRFLEEKGFSYAKLALGVIEQNTPLGGAAIEFMKNTAAQAGKPMSDEQVSKVIKSMTQGYLDALGNHLNTVSGTISGDVSYAEAWAFHNSAFLSHGYSPDAWTLNSVFLVLDEAGRKAYWDKALGVAGDLLAETKLAVSTLMLMSLATEIGHDEQKKVADAWLDRAYSWNGVLAGAGGGYEELTDVLATKYKAALDTVSPLVLDLDGNGIQTTGLDTVVYFDHNGDGFAERTGWVNKSDGFLVFDKNQNGLIDSGAELFGNHTKLSNGTSAANGFAALQELDANRDGVINSADSAYFQLSVWKDSNSNGRVDAGELLTLVQAGVQEIRTQYSIGTTVDAQGNQARQIGSYTGADGSVHAMNDIWFVANQAKTRDLNQLPLNSAALAVADLPGMGTVQDFRQVVNKDQSGYYTQQLSAFSQASTAEERHHILQDLMFHWSGADQYGVNSRGGYIDDGRKLYALESFMGTTFIQSIGTNAGTNNPGPNAAAALMKTFASLENFYYVRLMIEGPLNELLSKVQLTFSSDHVAYNLSAFLTELHVVYNNKGTDADTFMSEFSSVIANAGGAWPTLIDAIQSAGVANGTAFQRALAHFGQSVTHIEGGELYGTDGDDQLLGLGGDDYLYGGKGNDRIEGGAGNDFMSGDEGSDTYLFKQGWGNDTIRNYDVSPNKTDTIAFGAGIGPGDIKLEVRGDHLLLLNKNTSDKITVFANFMTIGASRPYGIDQVTFSDGTVWDRSKIREILLTGTPGNDTLTGFESDDLLVGGAGNDELNGGGGSDTYRFEAGWGQDVIRSYDTTPQKLDVIEFGSSVMANEIKLVQSGSTLIITRSNSTDKITVLDMFAYSSFHTIDLIRFADGTSWGLSAIRDFLKQATEGPDQLYGRDDSETLDGKGGDDQIYGQGGNDTLIGGTGNDTLDGGAGSDIYQFDTGWGQDRIATYDLSAGKVDSIQFGQGIAPTDITLSRNDTSLVIARAGSSDKITLPWMFFYSSVYTVDQIVFADGTRWDVEKIREILLQPTAGADLLYGDGRDDVIYGMGGNDYLYGMAGNDVLIGGAGNDYLDGGTGSDTFRFDIGWGQDTVSSYDMSTTKVDVIKFGAGIKPGDITLSRVNDDLNIMRAQSTDKISVSAMFAYANIYTINEIRFEDGTIWDVPAIKKILSGGTEGKDTLYGDDQNNVLNGLGGDDYLNGKGGNDVLIGGAGNDTLDGGSGSDIYHFDLNWGQDTINTKDTSAGKFDVIEFGEGISGSDIRLSQSSSTLTIARINSTDKITLPVMYAYSGLYTIDEIRFQDGSVWSLDLMRQKLLTATEGTDVLYGDAKNNMIDGLGGNDELYGGGGNDILIGGKGNDTLDGGTGSDIYHFDKDWGQDTISANDSSAGKFDVIEFGVGISSSDIQLSQSSNTLTLSRINSSDKITLPFMYTSAGLYTIDQIRFQDGTNWDLQQIRQTLLTASEGADTLYGGEGNDTITGLGGNDYLYGRGGNDVLIGGTGNDVLDGGSGSDIYHFDPGWGQDLINAYDASAGKKDVIEFGAGIKPEDISLVRTNNVALTILKNGSSDSISLPSMYSWGNTLTIDEIRFADGTGWDSAKIATILLTPTEGADKLYGFAGADILQGLGGDDYLYGLGGDDILIGGAGNDYLDGGLGSDTFKFEPGWGKDTIINSDSYSGKKDVIAFGGGILPADIVVTHAGGKTILTQINTSDSVSYASSKNGFGAYAIEEIRFDNGVVWDAHIL